MGPMVGSLAARSTLAIPARTLDAMPPPDARSAPRPYAERFVHLRDPVPLHFPESAEMPESIVHLNVRTCLYQLLSYLLGPGSSVGSEQFVYWDRSDPRMCLAPDAFVKLGVPQTAFGTWRCWEHGAPDLAIEVVSSNDRELDWALKLARYAAIGVEELVLFDPDAAPGERLRVWDRLKEDLVERRVEGDTAECVSLAGPGVLRWVVSPVALVVPVGLRLADAEGRLVLLPAEAEAAARRDEEAARRAEAEGRRAEAEGRRAAEARVRELEEELRRRKA